MKMLIYTVIFLIFQISAFAAECPNYSGRYIATGLEPGSQELVISQSDCTQIKMDFKAIQVNGSESAWVQNLILDGQRREVATDYLAVYQWSGSDIIESGSIRLADGSFAPALGRWFVNQDGRLAYRWNADQGIGIRAVYEKQKF